MPDWAAGIIAAVVVGTGGYVVRMLVRIAGTLGNIDAKLDSHGNRLTRVENYIDRRWEGGHL